eukprot:15325599-Ditylum_brightwellii.AAC.2
MTDTQKSTSDHLSADDGKLSWTKSTESKKEALLGICANNNPLEGLFAVLDNAISHMDHAGLDGAAGEGWSCFNNNMGHCIQTLVTGCRSKKFWTSIN